MQLCRQDLSDCPAITKCPFVHACPGDTEKSCAGDVFQVRTKVLCFSIDVHDGNRTIATRVEDVFVVVKTFSWRGRNVSGVSFQNIR